eukprot:6265809-Amphidinium_carterae.1
MARVGKVPRTKHRSPQCISSLGTAQLRLCRGLGRPTTTVRKGCGQVRLNQWGSTRGPIQGGHHAEADARVT